MVEERWADYECDWQPFTAAGVSRATLALLREHGIERVNLEDYH